MKPKLRRALKITCAAVLVATLFAIYYVRTHPLIFNESLWSHAHCIKQVGVSLHLYASDHDGRFPAHTNGYGDALLLMDAWLPSLTGPGYGIAAFQEAQQTSGDVPEGECGRVYVQGLSKTNSPEIALLFDKLASPGDHKHFPARLWAPAVREVLLLDGSVKVIKESEWAQFAKQQIELLVHTGVSRNEAEAYYTLPNPAK